MQLKDKETGKTYKILSGKILKPREVKKKDITASFICLQAEDGEEIGIIFGYTKDGIPSESNKFDIIEEKT